MNKEMEKKVQAAILAAAPTAMNTLCVVATDAAASVTSRLKASGSLIRYMNRIDWKPNPSQAATIASFLQAVSNDRSRGDSTRGRARKYLAEGTKLNLWKLPS